MSLIYFSFFTLSFFSCSSMVAFFYPMQPKKIYTVMIDPGGDIYDRGRSIEGDFEQTLTSRIAHLLKKELEKNNASVNVLLTRSTGKKMQPFEQALYANRSNVDCFISLHCFLDASLRSRIFLYTFSYGNDFVAQPTHLSWTPYDQAYRICQPDTKKIAATFKQVISSAPWNKHYECCGPFNIPFKPLIGIARPALAIEIGLRSSADWQTVVHPLIDCLEHSIST